MGLGDDLDAASVQFDLTLADHERHIAGANEDVGVSATGISCVG